MCLGFLFSFCLVCDMRVFVCDMLVFVCVCMSVFFCVSHTEQGWFRVWICAWILFSCVYSCKCRHACVRTASKLHITSSTLLARYCLLKGRRFRLGRREEEKGRGRGGIESVSTPTVTTRNVIVTAVAK